MESNTEAINQRKAMMWNKFSAQYTEALSRNLSTSTSVLANLARVSTNYKILDAGCGPGISTKLLCSYAPNNDVDIYAMDLGSDMITLAKQIFTEFSDFNANSQNHWEVLDYSNIDLKDKKESNLISIAEDNKALRQTKKGKIVKFFVGSVENLPFREGEFDCYTSNLVVNLVNDVDLALQEAYRVLKPNGIAAFSIWGDKKYSKAHSIFIETMKQHNIEYNERQAYYLSEDLDGLKARFKKAGFKTVKLAKTGNVYDAFTVEDYFEKFQNPFINETLSKYDETTVHNYLTSVKEAVRKELIENDVVPSLDITIIVAFK